MFKHTVGEEDRNNFAQHKFCSTRRLPLDLVTKGQATLGVFTLGEATANFT